MAAAIKNATGVDCELIAGGGGVFDVVADGNTIYSKHETGRFPNDDEVLTALENL
ncbi:MAG: hypothetical protein CMJ48_14955 [Planctomycetaceae bacterium]|nr:hypothetical protein [Planctomycetaceae bacterium]